MCHVESYHGAAFRASVLFRFFRRSLFRFGVLGSGLLFGILFHKLYILIYKLVDLFQVFLRNALNVNCLVVIDELLNVFDSSFLKKAGDALVNARQFGDCGNLLVVVVKEALRVLPCGDIAKVKLCGLLLCLYVDVPVAKAVGQANVEALLSNGQRELAVGNNGKRLLFVLVKNDYASNFGRAKRVLDEHCRFRIVAQNVDLFAKQFVDYVLDANALKAYASANRVNVLAGA